jgi:hypothetical protein
MRHAAMARPRPTSYLTSIYISRNEKREEKKKRAIIQKKKQGLPKKQEETLILALAVAAND